MAQKKENRFEKKHHTIDPNDPASLLSAGKTQEVTPAPVQEKPTEEEKPKEEKKPASQPQKKKPQKAAESSSLGFDLEAFEEKQKQAKKAKNKVNTSFTISPEVHEALMSRYKKAGFKSAAAYLDSILKAVFGLEE